MPEVAFELDDESPVQLSLAEIQRSISALAIKQHELHELIRDFRSEFQATQSTHTTVEEPIKVPSAVRKNLRKGFTTAFERAVKASGEDASSLDSTWPVSLQLRPYLLVAGRATLEEESALRTQITRPVTVNAPTGLIAHEPSERRCYQSGIILPASPFRTTLDVIGVSLLAWDLILTPIQLAWNMRIESWLFFFAVVVSLYWTLDLMTFFRTAYYTTAGELETKPLKIASRYLRRQFFIDFLIVSCDWANIFAVGLFPSGLNLLRVLKLTRLLRIFQMIKLSRFERVQDFVNALGIGHAVLESIKILAITIWLTHVIACVWFAIGNIGDADTGLHWLDFTWAENAPKLREASLGYQYFSALQWTLATMLSGNTSIFPRNSIEQTFCCTCILLGLMVQAFVVSVLSSSAVEEKEKQRSQTNAMSSLNKFCANHQVNANVWLLARSQVRDSFVQSRRAALKIDQVEGLKKISVKMRMTILHQVFEPQLSRHSLFALWSQSDKRTFSKLTNELMDLRYAHRGHDIFMAGELASAMYLLSTGSAKYSQNPESSKVMQDQVQAVALDTWFSEAALWVEWLHVGTMEAESDDCEVHKLCVEGFLELATTARSPLKILLRNYGLMYHQRLRKSVPPDSPWPSDVQAHGTSYVQIINSMHESARKISTSLVLDYARGAGLVDEYQSNLIEVETEEGKANVAIVKTAAHLSMQRVISVARVFVSRSDGRSFVEIGQLVDETLIVKVQYPGAKQLGSEDINATVRRVVDRLKPVLGDLEMKSADSCEAHLLSNKVNVSTHYHFFDAHFVPSEVMRPTFSSGLSGEVVSRTATGFSGHLSRTVTFNSGAVKRRRANQGFGTSVFLRKSSTVHVAKILRERMLSGNQFFTISGNEGSIETFIYMWLDEQEMSYLTSREGTKFVDNLMERGDLTVGAIKSNIKHSKLLVACESSSSATAGSSAVITGALTSANSSPVNDLFESDQELDIDWV